MMSDREKRLAIAEACGWKYKHFPEMDGGSWGWVNGEMFPQEESALPNYLSDLNAIHEAIKTLSDDNYNEKFNHALCVAIGSDPDEGFDFRPMQEATARQRADAFLLAIGKLTPAPSAAQEK